MPYQNNHQQMEIDLFGQNVDQTALAESAPASDVVATVASCHPDGRMVTPTELAFGQVRRDEVTPAGEAACLLRVLDSFGITNVAAGLAKAVRTSRHRPRIQVSCGAAIDEKAAGALDKSRFLPGVALAAYFASQGYEHLVLADSISLTPAERIVRRELNSRFAQLSTRYGGVGPNVCADRATYAAELQAVVDAAEVSE